MTTNYRPDIDGLRAIAVLSVVIFHSGTQILSGGYVGVDIFFVISGYLITSIIVREIENDDFSIAKFYERRCRRILPALIAVVMFSLILGFILFHPTQLIELGKSVVATSLFASNIFFYQQSGYFETTSELKPLLHTWSLAVEEQYYIFFPLLLLFIAKYHSKQYAKWLISLTMISLIVCILATPFSPSATFYLIPTRAWELLLGSLLAINLFPSLKNQRACDFLSLIGLALISYSVFFYTRNTSFPGVAAIAPTVGAALIIYSGINTTSLVGKLLSFKPMVFIGLISYSLYLWHWPILAYTRYYYIQGVNNTSLTIVLCLIFILAVFSWRYIEKPFRDKMFLRDKSSTFIASSISSLIIMSIGLVVILKNGIPNRYEDKLSYEMSLNDAKWQHWGSCQKVTRRMSRNQDLCDIGDKTLQASYLFWGDSHARALAPAIDLSAKTHGLTGKIATKSGCPPLLLIDRPNNQSCYTFNNRVVKYIENNPNITTVFLAARWALSTNGTRYKNEHGRSVKLIDIEVNGSTNKTNVDLVEIGLRRTIDKLQALGRTVILVRPTPEIGFDVPASHFVATISDRNVNLIIAPSLSEYMQRTESVNIIFTALENEKQIKSIDPAKYLCDNKYCMVVANNIPLYRDEDHMSTFGAEYLSVLFDDVFGDMHKVVNVD